MAVAGTMGPERVCPEEPGPPEAPNGSAGWSGDEEEEEEEGGGYLYQPLSQEPEQGPGEAGPPAAPAGRTESGPDLQERLQMMRLYLPDPPADSEEEGEEEAAAAEQGAVAPSSRSSIPMDPEHVELVKRTMAGVKLPSLGIPAWASQISEDQWKAVVQRTLQARQSLSGPPPEWK
ncbi:male-enhanced antigen 1 [Indicator indicator]|uniref:male-enhanced antigen 1 n=1 Tax=Indicator indicator TaxID=1002788 RepID=UPI0023DEB1E4|nr:male-enhanced antigen 1 [Indicator indicator]